MCCSGGLLWQLATGATTGEVTWFPGILSRESDDVAGFQHGREEPMHLPYLTMSNVEFEHRINSLNHHGDEYEHFETTENAELSHLTSLISGTLNPLGQVHIWIGAATVHLRWNSFRCCIRIAGHAYMSSQSLL